MAGRKGGQAAMAAASEHLGGGDGDPPGGRQDYTLDQDQIDQLLDAQRAPGDEVEAQSTAFWKAAADRGSFLYNTVELAEDWEESGAFSAWPATEAPDESYDLSEGAHTLAIDRMETIATEAILSDRALVQDVRDFLLDQIKVRPKPWSGTSAGEQQDVAAACEHAGRELVEKILAALVSGGHRQTVRVLLTKIASGADIIVTGKVKVADPGETDAAIMMLHHSLNKHVMITAASVEDYSTTRDADIIPDQLGMGFEADTDDEE